MAFSRIQYEPAPSVPKYPQVRKSLRREEIRPEVSPNVPTADGL